MKDEQAPEIEKRDEYGGTTVISRHPAFGTVSTSRPQGNARLFDSEFRHQHYITLRINTAETGRSLSRNWVHTTGTIVEVAMSEVQWSTIISSHGQGEGTPCTIQHVKGEQIPHIKHVKSESQMHVEEFDEHIQEVYNKIEALENQIAEAKMTNKLRETLKNCADSIRTAAGSNLKFVANSFSKHMEKTVECAKIEISSYALNQGINKPPVLDHNDSTIEVLTDDEKQ